MEAHTVDRVPIDVVMFFDLKKTGNFPDFHPWVISMTFARTNGWELGTRNLISFGFDSLFDLNIIDHIVTEIDCYHVVSLRWNGVAHFVWVSPRQGPYI